MTEDANSVFLHVREVERVILRCYATLLMERRNGEFEHPDPDCRNELPRFVQRLHDATWQDDVIHGLVTIAVMLRRAYPDRTRPGEMGLRFEACEILSGEAPPTGTTLWWVSNKIIHARRHRFLPVETVPARLREPPGQRPWRTPHGSTLELHGYKRDDSGWSIRLDVLTFLERAAEAVADIDPTADADSRAAAEARLYAKNEIIPELDRRLGRGMARPDPRADSGS